MQKHRATAGTGLQTRTLIGMSSDVRNQKKMSKVRKIETKILDGTPLAKVLDAGSNLETMHQRCVLDVNE